MGGDPGQLGRLDRPDWPALGRRRARPTRVSETRKPTPAKTPPPLPMPGQAAQAALVDRILKGQSKIGIDVSSFTPNPAVADTDIGRERLATGARFKAQYEGYLKELAATPAGFKLLSDLDQSKHKTTIVFDLTGKNQTSNPNGIDATDKKKGDAPTITMNPSLKFFDDNKGRRDQPWMSEREKYGFYHELVHAWHVTRGTQATGSHKGVDNSEWQATGYGPQADRDVNENAIRRAFNKAERPGYSDVKY